MSASAMGPLVAVGVDGSPQSRDALRWAARDAALRQARLRIVTAVPPLVGAWLAAPVPVGVLEWEKESAQCVLDEAAQLVKDVTDGSVPVTTSLHSGSAVPTLVDLSAEADLVVVGRSGRNAVSRALLGSVSSGVLHRAHCPVAVVDYERPPDSKPPVLVGVDGSRSGERALAIACQEASLRGVDVIAVHAWGALGAGELTGTGIDELSRDLDHWLAEQVEPWRRRYPAVTFHRRVLREPPARCLAEFPEPVQLVVVGSHGYGGFAGMLLGSVSHGVVQSARVPVIVACKH